MKICFHYIFFINSSDYTSGRTITIGADKIFSNIYCIIYNYDFYFQITYITMYILSDPFFSKVDEQKKSNHKKKMPKVNANGKKKAAASRKSQKILRRFFKHV